MSPPSEADKYEGVDNFSTVLRSPNYWQCERLNFQDIMRRQSLTFAENCIKNQEQLYASIADLKLGLVISHAEISEKVDHLTLGQNRVENNLDEHRKLLYAIQENLTELRMDMLHGILPSQQQQQQQQQGGGNQCQQQQQSGMVIPPGFSSPVAVPIGCQSPTGFTFTPQTTTNQEEMQTGSSSIVATQCPSNTEANTTTALPPPTTTPEVNTHQPLTSTPEQEMDITEQEINVTDQVEVTIPQRHSTQSTSSQGGNGGQIVEMEVHQQTLPPSNPVPVVSPPQSTQQDESETEDTIIDCIFTMDCCGAEISLPIKYNEGRTRSLDEYDCCYCNKSYSAHYYTQHIKKVCMPKFECALCGAGPRVKSSARKRGRQN